MLASSLEVPRETRVKCSLLSDFNQNWNVVTEFRSTAQYKFHENRISSYRIFFMLTRTDGATVKNPDIVPLRVRRSLWRYIDILNNE